MLCNNMSESFNAFILDARDKPIITMLEIIRSKIMERIAGRKAAMAAKLGTVCPKIKKLVDVNIEKSIGYSQKFNGEHAFEVGAHGKQFVVNVKSRTCSCGAWQLSGIPCPHSIPCLIASSQSPLESVANCYKINTFLRTYSHVLQPLEGMSQWPRDRLFPLQQPKEVRLPGRPKKSRKKAAEEVIKVGKTLKLKKWPTLHCSWCGKEKHNKTTCQDRKDGKPQVKVRFIVHNSLL